MLIEKIMDFIKKEVFSDEINESLRMCREALDYCHNNQVI